MEEEKWHQYRKRELERIHLEIGERLAGKVAVKK